MLPTLKLAVDMLLAIFLMAFSVDRSRAVIHIYAASNKTMVLECPLNKTAEAQIVWWKNNQTLKFNTRISLFEKHGLKISALNYDDDGEYTCVSSDNKTSEAKQLQVTSKPKIQIQEPFRKHVREGVNVIRKCRSHGIPRPTVEWFTNRHQRVNISDNSTSQTARMNVVETIDGNTTLVTLTISPVLYSDNGVFTCIASNRHSTVTESSRVDVRYSPKMTSLFNTTRVVHWWEKAVVNLTCTADGNPFPTITWSSEAEDGDSVLNCSNEEMRAESTIARSNCWIRSLNSSYQGGNYSCFAENNLGKTLAHSFVVQRIYPPPPVQFRLAEVTSKAFIMAVHVPRDDNSPPPRYVKIKYRATTGNFKHEFMSEIDENGNSNISLPGILPRKHYEISMAAVNKAGYGLWTSTIQESGDMLPTTTTTTQKIPSYNITKNDQNSSAQVNNPRSASSSATSSWLSVILSLVLTAAGCQLTFHKKFAFLRHCDFLLDFKKNDFNET